MAWPEHLDLESWQPWRPEELAARLAGVDVPWWVCAGWAVDLHLGEQTREHEDLEFGVNRPDFPVIRDVLLPGHELYSIGGPDDANRLGPNDVPGPEYTQVWTYDPAAKAFRTDTFVDPGNRDEWVSKRDPRVRLPLSDAIAVTATGIPYQRPEVVLFMKAKHRRAKDEADLAHVWPTLTPARRDWFSDALALVHPGHPWLAGPPR